MPALSPTMETGKLVKWHVKEGDEVRSGNVIAEIETDKATMEVEAVDEGTIGKLINDDELKTKALNNVEQNGIVFLDEIDKIASRQEMQGADVSRQGVQRDLLPLIEGTTVATKHGQVKTDHILFIASGAFHTAKPSDLLPELQGRLPIRVELKALTRDDMKRILTEPEASLIKQYVALLATEGVMLDFTEDGIAAIAWTRRSRPLALGCFISINARAA